MDLLVHHAVEGGQIQEQLFDTTSKTFVRDFRGFCTGTGRAVKDALTFRIAQDATQTGRNFNEIAVSVEVRLRVIFGNLYNDEDFSGTCNATINFTLNPTDPGLYMAEFSNLDRTIANVVIGKYQDLNLLNI